MNKKGPYFDLNWILCVILALFIFPNYLLGGIARLQKNPVIGIVWFLTFGFFGFGLFIDLITIILQNKIMVIL